MVWAISVCFSISTSTLLLARIPICMMIWYSSYCWGPEKRLGLFARKSNLDLRNSFVKSKKANLNNGAEKSPSTASSYSPLLSVIHTKSSNMLPNYHD